MERSSAGVVTDVVWVQCERPGCGKWRLVPGLDDADAPCYCELNPDPEYNMCSAPQQPDDAVLSNAVLSSLPLPSPPPPTLQEQPQRTGTRGRKRERPRKS